MTQAEISSLSPFFICMTAQQRFRSIVISSGLISRIRRTF